MIHNEDLQKQNQLITLCYLIFFLGYLTLAAFSIFTYNQYFISGSGLFFVLIYLLMNVKVSPKIVQLCIVIFLNVLILLLILKSFYLLNIYWLIFYLILIGLYLSIKLIVTASALVSIEIIIIHFEYFNLNSNHSGESIIMLALTTAIILIGIIQSIFIQFNLKRKEKEKEKQMQESISQHAYLQLVFEYTNDAIAVFDLNRKIKEVNPAFEKLYGWKREECIGKFIPITPPRLTNDASERFSKILEGDRFIIESQEMRKDGTVFDAQISLSPIYNRDGTILAVSLISRDISYRKEHERLQMQSEKLKLAGEIAAGVAHEIRNPMTVISSFVQMMQAEENNPYKDFVNIVQDEVERIDLIISEFLILSRPQMKEKEWVNLMDVIHYVSSFYQMEFKSKNIEFEFQTTLEEANIYGNKNQLKQVFINLIKNAFEAIDQQGFIKILLSKQESSYLITIQDNGCGISEDVLEHIFEPFYTTKTKGTGLGMMITNKIVQDHHGSMKVFSKENVGTDIHIQFAIHQN